MTAVAVDARITHDEYRVLARYANGEIIRQIANTTGTPVVAVRELIANVAENNRGRALKIVDQYEKSIAEMRVEPEEAPAEPEQPAENQPLVTGDELVWDRPDREQSDRIDGVVELLDAAVATGDHDLVEHAERIRTLIRDLQTELHEHAKMRAEAVSALIDERTRIQGRLAEIRAQLEALGGEIA